MNREMKCRCLRQPKGTMFEVGKRYAMEYQDSKCAAYDDNGAEWSESELEFYTYFQPVGSPFCPENKSNQRDSVLPVALRLVRKIVIDVYPNEYTHHHIEINSCGDALYHRHGDEISTRCKFRGFDLSAYSYDIYSAVLAEILTSEDQEIDDDDNTGYEWRISFNHAKGCYKKRKGFISISAGKDDPAYEVISWLEKQLNADFGLKMIESDVSHYLRTMSVSGLGKPILELIDEERDALGRVAEQLFSSIIDKSNGKNRIISPVSMIILLAILCQVSGETERKEIEQLFGLEQETFRRLSVQINAVLNASSCIISNANAIYLRSGTEKSIKKDMADQLNAEFNVMTLNDEARLARSNGRRSQNAKDLIRQIIDRLDGSVELSILNAITYEDRWAKEYTDFNILDGQFTCADGAVRRTAMLQSKEINYLENEHVIGVLKPYKNSGYHFMALLPKASMTPEDALAAMKPGDISDLVRQAKPDVVVLKMPEFEFDDSVSFTDALQALGVRTMFDPEKADLTKLIDDPDMYFSEIKQETMIEVSRRGTRAFAVSYGTLVMGGRGNYKPKEIVLDRPFIFGIVDAKNGLLLFLGVANEIGV